MWRYLHIPKMSVCEGNHINLRCGYVNVPTYTQDVGSWLVPSAFRKTEIFRGTIFNPSPPILPSLSGEPFNYQSINQSIKILLEQTKQATVVCLGTTNSTFQKINFLKQDEHVQTFSQNTKTLFHVSRFVEISLTFVTQKAPSYYHRNNEKNFN